MLRGSALICAVSLLGFWQSDRATLDPVGKWNFSTTAEDGSPATGQIEVTGKPGVYTGRIVTNQGRELPINDLMTSRDAILILAELPDGAGTAVIKIARQPSGTFTGHWGAVRGVIPAKIERATRP
jgi:hypothetical protein